MAHRSMAVTPAGGTMGARIAGAPHPDRPQ